MSGLSRHCLCSLLFFIVVVDSSGQGPGGGSQTRGGDSLTIERALTYYRLSSPVFSSDGNKCAFLVSQPASLSKPGANHIWLLDLRDSTTRQYTNSDKSESSPKWAPNGKKLAFLSNRGGESQIYTLDDNGGEALPLTASKTGVGAFEWAPDGKSIAYVERDSATAEEKKRKDDKYDETVMGRSDKATLLFTIDVATKAAHRQPGRNWRIADFKYLPSGDGLVLEVEELPAKEIPVRRLVRLDLKGGSYSDIPSPSHSSWGDVEIAPGGTLFSFAGARVDGPVAHDLFVQSFGQSEPRNITGKTIDLPVRNVKFISDELMSGMVQRGMHSSLYKISVAGKASDWGIGKNVLSYDLSPDNKTVVFVSATASSLQELWLYKDGQKAVQLTHFNKAFDKIPFVAPETISYKSFDGKMIETLFFKPVGKPNASLPMVVIIHGGPTGAFADSYNEWAQLFLQKGYAVMMPNIRGSTGYGWKFLEANRKDWGGGDFKDVMAGIDYLIANKGIDSGRLAIVGWSYGGYMSEWAITQTNRFKAAMAGAGLFNLASEFGTENGAAYDNWHLGTPYENPEDFARQSAISHIKNARTPTLIIQGRDDDVDPIGQSQELYRALRYYKVPTELVLYPNERHGFVDLRHKIDYISRMMDWVGRYL